MLAGREATPGCKVSPLRNVSGWGPKAVMAVAIRGLIPISRRVPSFPLASGLISASSFPISAARCGSAAISTSSVAMASTGRTLSRSSTMAIKRGALRPRLAEACRVRPDLHPQRDLTLRNLQSFAQPRLPIATKRAKLTSGVSHGLDRGWGQRH